MNCTEFEELILEESASEHLAEHLRHCESCRLFQAAQAKLDEMLRHRPVLGASPHFSTRVMALARSSPPRRSFAEWGLNLAGLASVAAASGLAADRLVPMMVLGGPWVIGALVFSSGVWIALRSAELT